MPRNCEESSQFVYEKATKFSENDPSVRQSFLSVGSYVGGGYSADRDAIMGVKFICTNDDRGVLV